MAEPSRTEFALGTVCTVTLFDKGKDQIYNDIFNRLREIENLMSVNIPSSDISRINAAAGIEPVQAHEETIKVIKRSVFYAEVSDGAFDPTVGPVVSLWGIVNENQRIPDQTEIDEILPLVNWRNIDINLEANTVFLKYQGMALDLGAIAKGYAADEAVAIIRNTKVKQAIIDLGGNVILYGEKKDKSLWRVGIQNPLETRGIITGVVQVKEKTVVTSGVYERFFEQDGKRYHHIFSPWKGYPSDSGLLSVTIIADNSMEADALSTAVFVLGYERSKTLLDLFPDTEAIFIFEDMSIQTTSALNLTITDKAYFLK
ncbi:MAG: FAD:protein FMN transferase [Treponema sp.]|nr:FAD:protein FMN transferase [Treponema sp.]